MGRTRRPGSLALSTACCFLDRLALLATLLSPTRHPSQPRPAPTHHSTSPPLGPPVIMRDSKQPPHIHNADPAPAHKAERRPSLPDSARALHRPEDYAHLLHSTDTFLFDVRPPSPLPLQLRGLALSTRLTCLSCPQCDGVIWTGPAGDQLCVPLLVLVQACAR